MSMSLSDQINADIKVAMLAKDKGKLDALRAAKSAFLLANTEKGKSGDLEEEDAIKIIQKLVKQRKESLEIYKTQNRDDLAQVESEQIAVLEVYLPAQMGEEELRAGLSELMESIGASSGADIGKAMGSAMKAFAGKADNQRIASIVKELLM